MISRSTSRFVSRQDLFLTMLLLVGMIGTPLAQTKAAATTRISNSLILKAARVFDGVNLNSDYAVLIVDPGSAVAGLGGRAAFDHAGRTAAGSPFGGGPEHLMA